MNQPLTKTYSKISVDETLPARLAEVLERYLADLENGAPPDCESLLAQHPELANELRPYLDSLRMLHGAAQDLKCAKSASADGAKETKHRQIGDYRIVREIGRGGMGIVYEAHQESLNRQVALKILPFAAVLDQRQIARFRTEAQAAAQLHHSHIVPVFAVGQEQGVYYYAMQYIEGQSLEQAIEELRLAEKQRGERTTKVDGGVNGSTSTLSIDAARRWSSEQANHTSFFRTVARLGIEAAEALHHAHEHGIIHRDVKPSNLLVDKQGRLWVTDFGLARMQADNGVTLTGDVVGTLRYMSPEQAGGEAIVDARTDVYSLGVTLYELLTRRHAHPGDDRQILLRQIVGEEPVPPRRIDQAVPADLETIVLSAMSKSREERYPTAKALAEDLERFLTGKPTLAKRPTLADRAVKWARRHQSLVKLAAAAVLMLCVVSTAAFVIVLREQAQTAEALVKAKKSGQAAREAVDHFGIRMADRLTTIPGAETAQRDLLIAALDYYHRFIEQAGDDPQLRQEIALAHFKSGAIAAKLGATTDAIEEYHAAKEILSQLAKADPGAEGVLAQKAVTFNNLGLLLTSRGEAEKAQAYHDAAIDIQQRLLREHPENVNYIDQLAESQANRGMLLEQRGDAQGAERSLRASINLLRSIAKQPERGPKFARNLAIVYNNLSYVLRRRDPAAADKASSQAIAILEALNEETGKAEYQDDLALCYNNMAALESQTEKWDDAVAWHERAIALQEQMVRKAPSVVRHRSELAASLNNLGVVHCRSNRLVEADVVFKRARELLGTLTHDYPDQLAYTSAWAALLNNQAMALAEAGFHEEALRWYPTAIEAQRKCWQRFPDAMGEPLSKMYYNYGQSLRQTRQIAAATQAALARRKVWRGNGQRLFGVAVELAEIARTSASELSSDEKRELHGEVIKTLRLSREAGWHDTTELADDERFSFLRDNQKFEQLIADVNGAAIVGPSAPPNEPATIDTKN
jgi:serine/threonine protein kinase/tetratricopeptide (TPR) repeat protein